MQVTAQEKWEPKPSPLYLTRTSGRKVSLCGDEWDCSFLVKHLGTKYEAAQTLSWHSAVLRACLVLP